jgi:hypothetical protein
MDTAEDYVTLDLHRAAFIVACGHAVRVVALGSGRHKFHFPADATADSLRYDQGAVIAGTAMAAAHRVIKAQMYSRTPTPHEVPNHGPACP